MADYNAHRSTLSTLPAALEPEPVPPAAAAPPRALGLWMCTALVVGNMIGSGVFMLPASLAPYGIDSVTGWLFTATGAVLLAVVFAELSRAFPAEGGPYAYTRAAFGDMAAFVVAWGYWVAVWIGNAAIATGSVSYLTSLWPGLVGVTGATTAVTIGFVWLFTFVNCWGVRAAGWVQAVTTVLKLMPLLAVAVLGLGFLSSEAIARFTARPPSFTGTTAAATLTLWAMLGLESATIPAAKVRDPARTIPLATMIGTLVTAVICAVACSIVLLIVPADRLAVSSAPFAEAARAFWGDRSATLVALFATISGLGALNGWILLHGEMPYAMARSGVFPAAFGRTTRRGTPAFALVVTSSLVTVLVAMNSHRTMVEVFTFMILLATSATLVTYLVCSLALLVLMRRGQLSSGRRHAALASVGVLGATYALWAIGGAGMEANLWGLLLLAVGMVLRLLARRPKPVAPP